MLGSSHIFGKLNSGMVVKYLLIFLPNTALPFSNDDIHADVWSWECFFSPHPLHLMRLHFRTHSLDHVGTHCSETYESHRPIVTGFKINHWFHMIKKTAFV